MCTFLTDGILLCLKLNISKDNSANPTIFDDENSTNCYSLLNV